MAWHLYRIGTAPARAKVYTLYTLPVDSDCRPHAWDGMLRVPPAVRMGGPRGARLGASQKTTPRFPLLASAGGALAAEDGLVIVGGERLTQLAHALVVIEAGRATVANVLVDAVDRSEVVAARAKLVERRQIDTCRQRGERPRLFCLCVHHTVVAQPEDRRHPEEQQVGHCANKQWPVGGKRREGSRECDRRSRMAESSVSSGSGLPGALTQDLMRRSSHPMGRGAAHARPQRPKVGVGKCLLQVRRSGVEAREEH